MIGCIDPGGRWGLAHGDGTTAPTVQTGNGYEAFRRAVVLLPDCETVYLELPFQQVVGTGGQGKVQQLRTWLAMRDILTRRFGLVAIRDLPVAEWQKVHGGFEAEKDPKCRSLRVVQALEWAGPWQTARGGVDGEAVDCAAMYAYLRRQ